VVQHAQAVKENSLCLVYKFHAFSSSKRFYKVIIEDRQRFFETQMPTLRRLKLQALQKNRMTVINYFKHIHYTRPRPNREAEMRKDGVGVAGSKAGEGLGVARLGGQNG